MNGAVFPAIDTSTLALARAIIQLTLAGLIIWTGSRQEQRAGTHWWAAGLALHGISLLFYLVRYAPLDSLITAANHLTLGVSSACFLVGFWRFGHRPVRYGLVALIVAIPAVSLLVWEWWMPIARWRILLTASSQLIFLAVLQAVLASAPRREMAGIYRVLRACTVAYALLLFWAYGSLVELLPNAARVPPGYHGVLFSVGSMLFLLALAVGALALQYAQLACGHADQARTDWLTGLLNRRGLAQAADEMRARRAATSTSAVLALDIDRFKAVNDRHGHAAGDRVLRMIAWELTRRAGPEAVVARVGGEEFQVLLPDTDIGRANRCAESLRDACSRLEVHTGSEVIRPSVSIGVALLGRDEALDDAARRADAALYRAKTAGRDRVEIDPAAQPA
ncbi:GGDEF domain-containing protein [Halomonas denitrificans]|nr:GGDEF domain-containing protein [Halomonas denitrificans]